MTILFASNEGVDFNLSDTTTAGRFDATYVDSAIVLPASAGGSASLPFDWNESSTDDTWVHFEIRYTNVSEFGQYDGQYHSITDGANIIIRADMSNDAMTWDLQGSTPIGTSYVPSQTSITTIDIHMNRNSGTDETTVTIYLNGSQHATGSFTAAGTGKATAANLGGFDAGDVAYISQIIVSETSTLGRKLGVLRPAGIGNSDQWDGDFNALGDSVFATVASSGVVGNRVSSTLSAWGGPTTGNIERLVLRANASEDGGGASSINQFVRFSGTNYDGANIVLDDSVRSYFTEFANNPSTAIPWTFTDLASTEIGLLAGV